MSSNSPPPNPPQPEGVQSMLDRLKGMAQALQPPGDADELLPTFDMATPEIPMALPMAIPVESAGDTRVDIPVAQPVLPRATPLATPVPLARPVDAPATRDDLPSLPPNSDETHAGQQCPICGANQHTRHELCAECGYYFADNKTPVPAHRIRDRYQLLEAIGRQGGVERFRALDFGETPAGVQVCILRQAFTETAVSADTSSSESADALDILPTFDVAMPPVTAILPPSPLWPSIAWELNLLKTLEQPALPRILDHFIDDSAEFLVEEIPIGRPLWDAWDDPASDAERRYGWMIELAEAIHSIHHCGAIFEGLRPDAIVVADDGQARLCDLSELLPMPLPDGTPLRGSRYGAPELMTGRADHRADLYSMGALLYALHVGRELSDSDFDRPGHPKPFVPRFPDVHPALGRLISKTFRREVEARFPTDEASKEDPSGFLELMRTFTVLQRTLDRVRLEIASWTTTGMIRAGNEDVFALIHTCESRQDDVGEVAIVLLADGMGGYEAGEVAAALAVQEMRRYLLAQPPFAALAGASPFSADALDASSWNQGHALRGIDTASCQQLVRDALKEANRIVHAAARAPGSRRRGMGCTAEVVYVDGRQVVVGHIGDSRTYHLHEGRLVQLTRDQTLVNRLVELGTLTPEEAETHPRRNELQQAVGGQPDVDPGIYVSPLKPGDWIVVCSDGLSNHVTNHDLKEMLLSEAQSAEMAARRLVNLANIQGATDNATVVVVRIT